MNKKALNTELIEKSDSVEQVLDGTSVQVARPKGSVLITIFILVNFCSFSMNKDIYLRQG